MGRRSAVLVIGMGYMQKTDYSNLIPSRIHEQVDVEIMVEEYV